MAHMVKNSFMEMLTFHSLAEYCDKSLDKHCFIAGNFGWCLENEAIPVGSVGRL